MHLPNGAQIFIDSARAAQTLSATAITNSATPEFTLASATGVVAGDILLVAASTWSRLVNRIVRVTAVDTNDVTVEGVDTSSTLIFPAGATATLIKLTGWTETPCVLDMAIDGGEQQYYNYQCLSSDSEQQLPTFKSAVSITYTLGYEYDDPTFPIFNEADESGEIRVFRMYVPKAAEMRYWAATVSFNDMPTSTVNEAETVALTLAIKNKFTKLAATQ